LCFAASGPTIKGKSDAKSAKAPSAKTSSTAKTGSTTHGKSHAGSRHGKKSRKTASWRRKGQQKIDSDRTRQIQEALIREHYLTGEPTGNWDQSTKDALARFQGTNGWQTKSVPDSRALIKLGLGPDKTGLLTPDTAVMMSPHELGTPRDVHPGGASQQ